MTVTFCGHADFTPNDSVRQWLSDTVTELIKNGADKFYLGGYGGFDQFAAASVWDMKTKYPDITSVLVLPYLDRKMNADHYDYTTYPPLEEVPRRFAISKRNEWLVDKSDVVIAYVTHDWGGAAVTLDYARRKKKAVLNYADAEARYSN